MPSVPTVDVDTGTVAPAPVTSAVHVHDVTLVEQEISANVAGFARGPKGNKGDTGEKGEKGETGSTTGSYLHVQMTPNAVWTVQHNLNFEPNLVVRSDDGHEVVGWSVTHPSANVSVLLFPVALTGTCRAS